MNVTEYRNLAEQVQKNKDDILHHFQRDEVLADFGIKIIGQVETADELPVGGNYGDAYAVGTESPFTYYIWTRANNISATDYWFNFGEIAIAGPQGPKGDKGDTGPIGASTQWYVFSDSSWNYPGGYHHGDMALLSPSGNVYRANEQNIWEYVTNIKGAQGLTGSTGPQGIQGPVGPQGPKGDTGDVGGFINIAGIIETEDQLPSPELIGNLTVAYLVGSSEPYDLYIQVGSTSATAQWFNAGPLNVATYVSVNGQFQNVWDADTKLDKVSTSGSNRAYGITYQGNQYAYPITAYTEAWSIPQYNDNKCLKSETPVENKDCANKEYVDNNTVAKADGDANKSSVYAISYDGTQTMRKFSNDWHILSNGTIAMYAPKVLSDYLDGEPNASLVTCVPSSDYQCANKKYVDDNIAINAITMTGNSSNYATVPVIYGKTWKQMAKSGLNFEGIGHLTMDELETTIYIEDNAGNVHNINKLNVAYDTVTAVSPDDVIDRSIVYTLRAY